MAAENPAMDRKVGNTNLLRIGYVPYSETYNAPGDYRRLVAYARTRNLYFENARPDLLYDLVVLSERADISIWSRYPHGKIVYDFIDSYLAIPRTDIKQWMRGLAKYLMRQSRRLQLDYWRALSEMCARADAVVCTTDEQRQHIIRYCPNAHVILDIHSAVTHQVKTDYAIKKPVKIVWEGLPGNLYQLRSIRKTLFRLRERYPLELHVVTDLYGPRFLGHLGRINSEKLAKKCFEPVVMEAWSQEKLAQSICACDIAIIPINMNDPLTMGKPENKLLLFWRMGMPVVTSATPAYRRAMERSGVGLSCEDESQWFTTLEGLIADESSRRRAGETGKVYADRYFGEEVIIRRWDSLFLSMGFDFSLSGASSACAG